MSDLVRLQKVLAAAGIASRRKAEDLILAGRVRVNGVTVTELGKKVDPTTAQICVDGKPLVLEWETIYVLLHKPAGVLTTRYDPGGRPTVLQYLPPLPASVHPVGRLDRATEGLLLLTNDGRVTHVLTHPRYEVPKVYRVWTERPLSEDDLNRLREGVWLEDGLARPRRIVRRGACCVEVTFTEGRKREVRRAFALLGHPVQRLLRVQMGPLRLGRLPVGQWRHLTSKEIRQLQQLVKEKLGE
ncbi:MAG TPA: rRNA pseudouridine synthase [Armatimonadetes bacterium]|nr:rRNA pseudouridine synthase [Armatimonadota bacterium]